MDGDAVFCIALYCVERASGVAGIQVYGQAVNAPVVGRVGEWLPATSNRHSPGSGWLTDVMVCTPTLRSGVLPSAAGFP